MNLHVLAGPPAPWLGEALESFERQFEYPLGASSRFRISHGLDYLPFFQAMGDAALVVAERDGQVLGTLALVKRQLELRERGAVTSRSAHYLCDLKVRLSARGSTILARMIDEARRLIGPPGSQACYSIVMDGTERLPTEYTGRLGVPRFEKLGEITVLRLSASGAHTNDLAAVRTIAPDIAELRARMAPAGYAPVGGSGARRSLMSPIDCVDENDLACGSIEDTRKGKRLFLESGDELLSAHLSGFAYASSEHGARFLKRATEICLSLGLPALFVALPRRELPRLMPGLRGLDILQAQATIYGFGLRPDLDWWVDTAEI